MDAGPKPKYPIRHTFADCCPRAASGQPAAAAQKRDELASFHCKSRPDHLNPSVSNYLHSSKRSDVSVGSKAALTAPNSDFSLTPESGLNSDIAPCPKRANSGLTHRDKQEHSNT
jgi:hypothetical protein